MSFRQPGPASQDAPSAWEDREQATSSHDGVRGWGHAQQSEYHPSSRPASIP